MAFIVLHILILGGHSFAGSISGQKFHDLNANGVKDSGEPGLAGWTINISVASPPVPVTTVTDSLGDYTFTNLDPDTYIISEEQQTSWQQTSPISGTHTVVLLLDQNVTDIDFGNARRPSLRGQKFNDVNNNSVKDAGEPGISGWTIQLDVTIASPPPPVFTSTDANGNYSFTNLDPGDYHVAEVPQVGWMRTFPGGSGAYDITIGLGDNVLDLNFGNHNPSFSVSIDIPLKTGWNIVSVPLSVPDYSVSVLFPNAASAAFQYNGGYIAANPLANGPGYLIKYARDTVITILGTPLSNQNIAINNGWNLVGSITYPEAASSLSSLPPGILGNEYWEYSPKGFDRAKTITPGRGYWVFSSGAGSLTESSVSCYGLMPPVFDEPPTPRCGSTLTATVGSTLNFTINAHAPNGSSVTLTSSSLPAGAFTVPALPIIDVFDSTAFFWTPTYADSGVHTVEFTATNSCGLSTTCLYVIIVLSPTSFAIPLTFTDPVQTKTVYWGVQANASFCLDPSLGEVKLPPPAPDLDVRFARDIITSENSCIDIGNLMNLHQYISTSQVDTYRVTPFNVGDVYPVTITWSDLSSYYIGTVRMVGGPVNVDMKSQTSYTFTDINPLVSFRIIASNPQYQPPPALPPSVATDFVDNIGQSIAVLHGTANPNNFSTTAWFEYGQTTSYGSSTTPLSIGNGLSNIPFSQSTGILSPNTTYHFRAVAQNSNGTSYGGDQTFITLPSQTQGQVIVPLTIQDQGGTMEKSLRPMAAGTITFGVHSSATYCLDSTFSELQLPPIPPLGVFDTRFLDPRGFSPCFGNGMNIDIRQYIDSAQIDTYQVHLQPGPSGYPMTISWSNLYSYYAGAVTLVDLFGGVSVNVNMKAESSYTVTDTTLNTLLIIAEGPGGNVVVLDSTKYRTFSQTDYAQRVRRLRTGSIPTAANVRDETFIRMGWFNNGLYLGIPKRDSVKYYGWLIWRRNLYRLPRFLPHTGPARGFDYYIAGHVWHISRYNPAVKYHDNHLAGEQYILKFNVGASDVGITPAGFGDLIFNDPTLPGNPCNGKTVRQIMAHTDSALMFFSRFAAGYFSELDSCLSRINRAFLGPIDSFSISPLTISGAQPLSDIPYLHPNPFAQPVVVLPIEYMPETENPSSYALYQNYPNPFNPMTVIEFYLASSSQVILKIYNVLGQEVATLFDHVAMEEGVQSVEFDAGVLPSGIYFYRLEAIDDETGLLQLNQARKMLLMK